jgi:hypothetical protein
MGRQCDREMDGRKDTIGGLSHCARPQGLFLGQQLDTTYRSFLEFPTHTTELQCCVSTDDATQLSAASALATPLSYSAA